MRLAARAQAAIEVLAAIEVDLAAGRPTALGRLTEWGRGARYAGAKDRRAVADLVYRALRRRGSYLWASAAVEAPPADRARMLIAALLLDAGETSGSIAERYFAGGRYEPAPLADAEATRLSRAAERLARADAVLHDFPPALRDALARSVAEPAAEIRALRERGAADLRVNRLKADRAVALDRLAAEGVDAAPGPLAPTAIRLSKPVRLAGVDVFEAGWVEPQDAASQATALLAGARPGEIALDYCAGAGGKTLALGAEMAGEGRLLAFDVDPERMADLPERARRAGVGAEILDRRDLDAVADAADLVFVDAPCTGSGAWARNPDAKWTTDLGRLDALAAAQAEALDAAARFVRPGGRLVYVTCSLLAAENQDRIAAFLDRRPDFEPADLAAAWAEADLDGAPPAGPSASGGATLIAPSLHQTDGFFVALLRRSGATRGR